MSTFQSWSGGTGTQKIFLSLCKWDTRVSLLDMATRLRILRRFTRGPNIFLMMIDQSEGFSPEELEELIPQIDGRRLGQGARRPPMGSTLAGPDLIGMSEYFSKKNTIWSARFLAITPSYRVTDGTTWHGWHSNENIVLDGVPLTKDIFYSLPGGLPPCPSGIYNRAWLDSIDDHERFKIFVTKTSEGKKMWGKPDSIRMGELFGRFDQFAESVFLRNQLEADQTRMTTELSIDVASTEVDRLARWWWTCFMGMHWGFRRHAVVYWACCGEIPIEDARNILGVDVPDQFAYPLDVIIFYRELATDLTMEHDLAKQIVAMTPKGSAPISPASAAGILCSRKVPDQSARSTN